MTHEPHTILQVRQEITDGAGRVILSMRRGLLDEILVEAGVATPEEMPEPFVRRLCQTALTVSQRAAENNRAERSAGLILENEHGRRSEFRSDDLGVDMVRRLMPIGAEEAALLCDPQYSPVGFELRVVEPGAAQEPHGSPELLGRCVLFTVLQPAALA